MTEGTFQRSHASQSPSRLTGESGNHTLHHGCRTTNLGLMVAAPQPKRDAIIAAAADHFATVGFANARISDIARQAEIGKGTVYEYFRCKEDLLLEACLWCCATSREAVVQIVGQIDPRAPVPALHRLVRAVLTIWPTQNQPYSRLFLDLWATSRTQPAILAQARERLHEVYLQQENALLTLIAAGDRAGLLRAPVDAGFLCRCFTACVDGFTWQSTFRPDLGPDRIASEGADLFMLMVLREPQRLRELCPLAED